MSYVREISLNLLLLCLIGAAVFVLADGPSMRQFTPASEAQISAVSRRAASSAAEHSRWIDPPYRSSDLRR
jgi:hypothetical protein